MLREIVLYPAANGNTYPWQADPNGSIYGGSNQIDYWRALKEGWDFDHSITAQPPAADKNAWIAAGTLALVGSSATITVSIDPAPTLALFNKVTIEALVDYGQGRANDWWFPPDNAYGPRYQLVHSSRDHMSLHGSGQWEIKLSPSGPFDLDAANINLRFPTGGTYVAPALLTWEQTSHPEGGPFTLHDLNNLSIGVSVFTSNGPSGLPVFNTKFHRLRIIGLRARIEVQDLGAYVTSARHNASLSLRLGRRARNTIAYQLPADQQPKSIGDLVHFANEADGWGEKALERNSGQIVQRTYWPEALRTDDVAFDLHDFSCEAWGAFEIPIAWTPELSGFSYLDKGGSFTALRAQDAWSLRPGDGAALRVLEDYANLSEEGLACHAGGDEQLVLRGYDFTTGWTTTDLSGGLTFSQVTDTITADELGYQTSTKFVFGGTPGKGGKKQTFALTSGDVVSVRARVRVLDNDDPVTKFLEVALLDGSGNYWDETNRTWSASAVYNAIPATGAFGELMMDQIPIPNTDTYTLKIGRFSSTIAQATFVVGLADLFKGADGGGMPLINLDVTSMRVKDKWKMDNSGAFRFLARARGMMTVELRPFWRAAELDDDKVKPIWLSSLTGGTYFDRFDFVAKDSGADLLRFTRTDSTGTQTLDCEIRDANGDPFDLTRAYVLRTYVRWLDSAGFQLRPPKEVAVGYAVFDRETGNFLFSGEATTIFATAPDATTEDFVLLGTDGDTVGNGLDGWIRNFEAKANPLTGDEIIWRR